MKCPYRIHKKEYPDSINKLAVHTTESFEDCYTDECPYWGYFKSDENAGSCGKAIAEMKETEKGD